MIHKLQTSECLSNNKPAEILQGFVRIAVFRRVVALVRIIFHRFWRIAGEGFFPLRAFEFYLYSALHEYKLYANMIIPLSGSFLSEFFLDFSSAPVYAFPLRTSDPVTNALSMK